MLYELGQHRIELPGSAPAVSSDDRLLLWQDGELVSPEDNWVQQRSEWSAHPLLNEEFVGLLDGHAYYTAQLDSTESWPRLGLRDIGLRSETAFMLAARARGLLDWRRQHRFCGQCGQTTTRLPGESAMVCEPCKLRFYPRVSPCVIVLITRGPEVLLAQGVRHRSSGWYSTLAGFVETGESLEQAVHREIREEVGVEVTNLRYQGSQTWPFPHQLMLGFWADYAGGDIVPEPGEIADAQWFHVDQLPQFPPGFSIAGYMIEAYRRSWSSAEAPFSG
ncbi:NAD(+) diphosphatase [Saccharospirillum sp. HFRX-1]|uniref:NAD(+) diphosphatase n=1 Tax=unclassified Saccharospirillum TaxID=2633430 RepID=UPI00371C2DB6